MFCACIRVIDEGGGREFAKRRSWILQVRRAQASSRSIHPSNPTILKPAANSSCRLEAIAIEAIYSNIWVVFGGVAETGYLVALLHFDVLISLVSGSGVNITIVRSVDRVSYMYILR
ncbi:hypothetical protein SCHPADRAFT_473008 [Schizopora paradoxa]|uniref:Uncharacterized protein n=1 Tax=Schizopora paradoxa TaxID=27342 RepID=A0A0H2RPS8_9AGAM|nr:hypothetical protein SCHPADRAFT_473008 [Schizopora paradoxa]